MRYYKKGEGMKQIISVMLMCAMSSGISGMSASMDSSAEIDEIPNEKTLLFKRLLHGKDLERTIALGVLEERCSDGAQWQKAQKEIVKRLLHIDLFSDLVYHPALMLLRSRSVKFKLRNTDDLEFKQDLFCIDENATANTQERQLTDMTIKVCKNECEQAVNHLYNLIDALEFKPLVFESSDESY